MLSKNRKTHKIIFKDGRIIPVAKDQFDLYRSEIELKRHNEFIAISDADTWELLFDGRCSEIKEFQKIVFKSVEDRIKICDFWTKHPLQEDCLCSKRFWCIWMTFRYELEKLWYNIFYPSQITEEMQNEFLRTYKK